MTVVFVTIPVATNDHKSNRFPTCLFLVFSQYTFLPFPNKLLVSPKDQTQTAEHLKPVNPEAHTTIPEHSD